MANVADQPIGDDEVVYRRVPIKPNWCQGPGNPISPDAFNPTQNDITGLSLGCASLLDNSPELEARKGTNLSGYYVVELRAGDLKALGMTIVARPLPDDPSHTEISNLTYDNRRQQQSKEWKVAMADLAGKRPIHGPFLPPSLEALHAEVR